MKSDMISRAAVVEWLRKRGVAHEEASTLPRQSLPDRLRREGSAQTCRMMADSLAVDWPDPVSPIQDPRR